MNLKLVLTYKWFDMIESGIKLHEYREIKPGIVRLLFDCNHRTPLYITNSLLSDKESIDWMYLKNFDNIEFYSGYSKDRKKMELEFDKISIGKGKPEWGAPDHEVFIIKLGKILK